MKAGAPLKRTGFARKTPMARTAKPASGKPKLRKCANRACRAPYEPNPREPFRVWCSTDCGTVIALDKLAKQKAAKAKAERAKDKAKRETFKKKGDYLHEAQTAFNAYIRYRDRDQPCICCGSTDASGAGGVGGGWDAGHWLSRGHAPHLRFNEQNVHKQRKGCNRPGGTTRKRYRDGLVKRIGLAAVEELERLEYAPTGDGWSIDDLKAIRDMYRAKLRCLQKAG